MNRAKVALEKLFSEGDIRINGDRPWDIRVNDERFYAAVVRGGSLAFGEAYMAGWWDCDALDVLSDHIFLNKLVAKTGITPGNVLLGLQSFLSNPGSRSRAYNIGEAHYNIGNDLFERMLDKRLTYTCGYWPHAKNLDEAQEAKLDLVCRKLDLKPGQTVLDIGCGWGSFAKFAAEKYKVSVVGITVSEEQVKLGRELCKGLPVEFRLEDYRETTGKFDHVVSLGMFEHVGAKNYHTYMKVAHERLKDGGLFLLHTIGGNRSVTHTDPWIEKYIFPNSMLPSVAQIGRSIEKLFIMEDWHSFGANYDKTLMAWFENFDKHWPEISEKYGNTFYRMWKFYLLFCAGSFRARENELWQVVLSKEGVRGGYVSVR